MNAPTTSTALTSLLASFARSCSDRDSVIWISAGVRIVAGRGVVLRGRGLGMDDGEEGMGGWIRDSVLDRWVRAAATVAVQCSTVGADILRGLGGLADYEIWNWVCICEACRN